MPAESVLDLDRWLEKAWVVRALSAFFALGSGTVIALSAWLEPAAEGHGTHLQLGLGQCSFLQLTDVPCPMCGATTTFALMAHLRFGEAIVNQPFAVLLFVMTVGMFAVSTSEVVQPRGRWGKLLRPVEPYEGWLAMAFLGGMAAAWLYKIVQMGALDVMLRAIGLAR
jgi:hypothetical protein